MSELRLDPTTRAWVIVAPERAERPRPVPAGGKGGCPLCPGNEWQSPPELFRVDAPDGRWALRVVPNKYPLLVPGGDLARSGRTGFAAMSGVGHHEVVVESADHQWDMTTARDGEVPTVLAAWRARHRALQDAGAKLIVVFRNHGTAAGTSLTHPHSQVVATPVVPATVRHAFDVARRHSDDTGRCLYVDIVRRESAHGTRVVHQTERFVALVPFAAAVPYETWVMPRTHRASFARVSDEELDDLAGVLAKVLSALREALDDPPYNLVVHSAPPEDERAAYYLWHLRIVPRLATPAGFELATGISVNSLPPEQAAARLRAVLDGE